MDSSSDLPSSLPLSSEGVRSKTLSFKSEESNSQGSVSDADSDSDSDNSDDDENPNDDGAGIDRIVNMSKNAKSPAVPPRSNSTDAAPPYDNNDKLPPPPAPATNPASSGRSPPIIRNRGRRNAMMPDTMTARLCEQAAARHELKRKAEEIGAAVDKEDWELCGITSEMAKKLKKDGDEEDEGDQGGGKRTRRNT
jgi:hypothetical protein